MINVYVIYTNLQFDCELMLYTAVNVGHFYQSGLNLVAFIYL